MDFVPSEGFFEYLALPEVFSFCLCDCTITKDSFEARIPVHQYELDLQYESDGDAKLLEMQECFFEYLALPEVFHCSTVLHFY